MSDKIDGHVQFTGSGWRFFEKLQPGLTCEDPINHSTCKKASAEREAALTEEDRAKREEEAAKAKAEVEAAAKRKAEEEAQALRDRAGQAKHEARRIAGLELQADTDAAKARAEKIIADAHAVFHAAVEKANQDLDQELRDAQMKRDSREADINMTDWLAKVQEKPNA